MPPKKFTTYSDQINLLKSRNVDISTKTDYDFADEVLKKVGYYGLINGYKNPFLDRTLSINGDYYKKGTTIQEIHALYEFDRVMRETFMSFILKVEIKIKSLISYYFSLRHGHDNYLIYTNFDTTTRNAGTYIPELIAEINRQIASRTKDPCIAHYLNNYGYIPLWVLNGILTFGTISKFYSLMQPVDKTAVSREFMLQPHDLENFIKYLSAVRNFCAHGNRLFCYNSGHRSLNDTAQHAHLNIPMQNSRYIQGKNDLFAAVIALNLLLSHNDYRRLRSKIINNLSVLKRQQKVLTQQDILDYMGFPANWDKL